MHQVSCIVHRTVEGPEGAQVWEALDGGDWAVLRLFVEKVEGGESIVRLMSHVESSTEVGLDELVRLEGQWWVKDEDWVEFYVYSSMLEGGEKDTIYGLAFANKEQCDATSKKVVSCVAEASTPTLTRQPSARPVSEKPDMERPESSRNAASASRLASGKFTPPSLLKQNASERSFREKSSRMASYKTQPPPPPDSTPPRHKCDSVSLIPPVPPSTPIPPSPTVHTPQPSPGMARRGGGGEGEGGKVRVSSFRRPSGTLRSGSPGALTGMEIGVGSPTLSSKGRMTRKLSLASFTNVERMIMAATDVEGKGMEIEEAVEAEMKKIASKKLVGGIAEDAEGAGRGSLGVKGLSARISELSMNSGGGGWRGQGGGRRGRRRQQEDNRRGGVRDPLVNSGYETAETADCRQWNQPPHKCDKGHPRCLQRGARPLRRPARRGRVEDHEQTGEAE